MAGLINMASQVQSAGRNGDTILAHINPEEARMLKAAGGSGTINPKTGLPEYGFFKSIFKTAAVVAGAYFLGPAGAGVVSGTVATGAMVGAGIAGLTGNNPLKGALLGGIGGFIAGGGLTDPSTALGETSKNWFNSAPAELAKTSGEQALGAAGQAAKGAGIQTTVNPSEFLADQSIEQSINNGFASPGSTPPAFKLNDVVGYDRAAANAIPQSGGGGGLLDNVTGWAKENPALAMGGVVALGSGIGAASEAESLAEQNQARLAAEERARMVQGGYGPASFAVTANPYVRRPGLLNASRA